MNQPKNKSLFHIPSLTLDKTHSLIQDRVLYVHIPEAQLGKFYFDFGCCGSSTRT